MSHKPVAAGADPQNRGGRVKYILSAKCFKTSGFLFFRQVFNIYRQPPRISPRKIQQGF
jgi:hypothetical protein